MDTDSSPSGEPARARQRVSTACEACRATKIRCQPSEQPGVCRKCLDSKRECISRTGPRTRRRRVRLLDEDSASAPPAAPPRPSKTFTIDFDIPSQPEVDENFDTLRDSHVQFLDAVFPPLEYAPPDPFASSASSPPHAGFPTPTSSHSHSIQSLHAKPQFNLDSAASLLVSFRDMLPSYPCIVLRPEDTVPSLAAERPFVLLAILAAASGSRTLQGHNLYDEEFRKVLGLKYVAGGERSLELLQGILIYCTWYPYHLRPKNKQALQYIRMARDLAHDLELDEAPPPEGMPPLTSAYLERIRAYLSYYYAVSAYVPHLKRPRLLAHQLPRYMTTWKHLRHLTAPFTPWTESCCDVLEQSGETEGDLTLATLVRLAGSTNAANEAMREGNEQQNQLVLLGLEAQHRELRQKIFPHASRSVAVQTSDMFFDIYLYGNVLLQMPRPRPLSANFTPASAMRLRRCVEVVKTYLTYIQTLDAAAFTAFTRCDWVRFIMTVILAIRVSFPLPECPDFDSAWARGELHLDDFLAKMCDGVDLTPVSTRVDVLSASRVVLRVVKDKYNQRVAALNTPAQPTPQGCPMLDGSLDQFIPLWDVGYAAPVLDLQAQSQGPSQDMMFHDLWATMTMGWPNEDATNQ